MRRIPTRKEDTYINYNGEIFIIKKNEKGNVGSFQFDGVSCRQGKIKGFIYKSFKTKSKWFNPDWWYKKTCWSRDETKLHFKEDDFKVRYFPLENEEFDSEKYDQYWQKVFERATLVSRPINNILKTILDIVNKKTNLSFEIDFKDLTYGVNWYEAYIPIKDSKGNKYLLTWENCD